METLSEIQREMETLQPKRLIELCLRLAKHKKENKELLVYLLFNAGDEESFVNSVKKEMDRMFDEVNKSNLYFAKKTIRKILRIINKYIRYSGKRETEIELRIYYCKTLKKLLPDFTKSPVLVNLYAGQVKKINSVLDKVHEDIRFDYREELETLMGI